ncbi:hypothetical protein EC91649_3037 [Escherichia coli 9.1649]|nr:hypothetical protein EC91649_3037 [Escherichia coli 9.1649]
MKYPPQNIKIAATHLYQWLKMDFLLFNYIFTFLSVLQL